MVDSLFPLLGNIRWQDIVDISINSYIIFRLYVLFRETNAFRVLIGIALLWFFQRVGVYLDLIVTSWAVQGITALAAIIIIVIFRNEIRNVLQAKNLKSILWGFSFKTTSTPTETIADGIFNLAERNIGALLVFPGKEDIKELVQNGLPWQGMISKEMIMSIFWHDNPVHDGAIIIKGNRITEVGAILPLTHRKDIPSHYGTRHRAALGLAEASDALIALVSEEKGAVLIAKGDKMTPVTEKEKLKAILSDHTGISKSSVRYPISEKFEISLAALISFLFVVGIWYSFSRGMETLITLETPIDYMNRDHGMEILETSVKMVTLHLNGSGHLLKSIRRGQVMVRVDLSNAVFGSNTFSITKENISLPPGVLLKKVSPTKVEVVLDTLIKKELPIQIDWTGKLNKNLILVTATIDPETIEVVGRSKILNNISTVYTQNIILNSIRKTGKTTLNIALTPASLKPAQGSKDKVKISYVVKERQQ